MGLIDRTEGLDRGRHPRHCARQPRPLEPNRGRLLVPDGKADGGGDRGVPSGCELQPEFRPRSRLRCASVAQTGRVEEARALLTVVRREQPLLAAARVHANVPYQTPELMERLVMGMRMTGLEE